MKLVADLHLHSHFSRATSKDLDIEHLAQWAQYKGAQLLATGDITHPGWLQEIKDRLEPAEEGLFRLKPEVERAVASDVPPACSGVVRFMLGGEISSIYKKHDQVRKVHNLIFAPSLEAVERIQAALEKIGNIRSDGRPILGLPSRDLLEIILEIDPRCYLIPAHIWTPWFSLLGSKSGYDSVEECFEDLTPHIFAVETGLSSDPPMNWRVSMLDRYTLVSNSDAHSPPKLAREATLFDTDLSYDAIFDALKTGDPQRFQGTIEFFPQEGKYHLDGHRKCNICWHPQITLAHNGLCAVCGKPVTVGVYHRVETLADRPEDAKPARTQPFHSLIPLPEVLAELHGVGVNAKRVQQQYHQLLHKLGPELDILMHRPLDEIERAGGAQLARGIQHMRTGNVLAQSGYDGEYGVIRVLDERLSREAQPQLALFSTLTMDGATDEADVTNEMGGARPVATSNAASVPPKQVKESGDGVNGAYKSVPAVPEAAIDALNPQQRAAITCVDRPLLIVAGPGTGKTRTLTHRIAHLIEQHGIAPQNILAITFTNKAAAEMRSRVAALLDAPRAGAVTIKTFHALGAQLLHEFGEQIGVPATFTILDEEERLLLLKRRYPDLAERALREALEQISAAKNQLLTPEQWVQSKGAGDAPHLGEIYSGYQETLHQNQALDFDDLLLQTVRMLEEAPFCLAAIRRRYRWISVDEYQDVNLAQYRLLRLLTGADAGVSPANLCVIGDPDQAIYSFRGADRSYFLRFAEDFPDARSLRLAQNYRSTQLILDASTQVIARAPERDESMIWSEFLEQTKVDIHAAPSDKAEAEYVVHQIEQMVGGTSYFSIDSGRVDDRHSPKRTFGDFAVLYRLGAQSHLLTEAFDRSGIPYQCFSQTSLYEHKEIRTLLAFLLVQQNSHSLLHWERVLNAGRVRVGFEVVEALASAAQEQNCALTELLAAPPSSIRISPMQRTWLRAIGEFLAALKTDAAETPVTDLLARVDQFLQMQHPSSAPDSPKQAERKEQLHLRALPFGADVAAFLESAALQSEADHVDPRADRVTLMTLHAAKGLEFPVVFMVGCEEGLTPYHRPDEETDIEEERRLFYVGMTRAQQKLVLTQAQRRFFFGQQMQNAPSRYVQDIEAALLEIQAQAEFKKASPKVDLQLKLFSI
ncbi:MAG: UvrD-helicase domain-containing protein [Caldilineaceae bacterium]